MADFRPKSYISELKAKRRAADANAARAAQAAAKAAAYKEEAARRQEKPTPHPPIICESMKEIPVRSFRPNRIEHDQVRESITRQLDFAARILAKAYNVLDTERIQTKGKPRPPSTAWPAQLQELSDVVTGNYADIERPAIYSTNDMKEAWKICEIYGSLPFISLEKRMTLRKVRGKIAWRKIANEFGLSSGYVAREIHDKILMELLGRAASRFPDQYAKPDYPYYQDKEWPKPTQERTKEDPWAFLPVKPA